MKSKRKSGGRRSTRSGSAPPQRSTLGWRGSWRRRGLPRELWLKVCGFLPPEERYPFATVCRQWRSVEAENRKDGKGLHTRVTLTLKAPLEIPDQSEDHVEWLYGLAQVRFTSLFRSQLTAFSFSAADHLLSFLPSSFEV